jgi:hypothetical protein
MAAAGAVLAPPTALVFVGFAPGMAAAAPGLALALVMHRLVVVLMAAVFVRHGFGPPG